MTKEERRKHREDQVKALKAPQSLSEPLERVQGDVLGISDKESRIMDINALQSDIIALVRGFCDSNDIEYIDGLRKAEQTTFNAICLTIGNTIFKPSKILKSDNRYFNGCATTNNNAYDIDKVCQGIALYDFFINLYNKVFTIWSLCAFLGVSNDFLYQNAGKLRALGTDLKVKSEQSLNDFILGKRNPTGAICILNHRFGYSDNSANQTAKEKQTVIIYPSLSDFKKQSAISDNNQSL